MQFLDREAAKLYLRANNLPNTVDDMRAALDHNSAEVWNFDLPLEHGKLLSGFKQLLSRSISSGRCFCLLESAGIWPSWQDGNLYGLMRKALGGRSHWEYGEGHVFESDETHHLISFATVFANFRWDFWIIEPELKLLLFSSHDDFIRIYMPGMDAETLSSLKQCFSL